MTVDRHVLRPVRPANPGQRLELAPTPSGGYLYLIIYPHDGDTRQAATILLPAAIVLELVTWVATADARPFVHVRKETTLTLTRGGAVIDAHIGPCNGQSIGVLAADMTPAARWLTDWHTSTRPAPPTHAELTRRRGRVLADLAEIDALLATTPEEITHA